LFTDAATSPPDVLCLDFGGRMAKTMNMFKIASKAIIVMLIGLLLVVGLFGTPQPEIAALVSAAGTGVMAAPGSAATLYGTFPLLPSISSPPGSLPTTLSGVSVMINGVAAPLYYISASQINLQIPWELTTLQTDGDPADISFYTCLAAMAPCNQMQPVFVTVDVSAVGSFGSWYVSFPVPSNGAPCCGIATISPTIFEVNSATYQGAILDSQYRLVSPANPALPGDVIQIYCTGLGPVSVPQHDGYEAGISPLAITTVLPQVTIGGIPATVLWAGLAPDLVGLYQVDVLVPAMVPSGNMNPLVISVNTPFPGYTSAFAYSNIATLAVSSPNDGFTLVSNQNPSTVGQPVIYTFSSPSNAVGEVEFNFTGPDYTFGPLSCEGAPGVAVVSGGYAVFLTNGQAKCITLGLTGGAGLYVITASYTGAIGDPICASANPATYPADSDCSITIVQNMKQPTGMTLTSNLNPSMFGQLVTFTAFLYATTATGTMTFYDGTTVMGVTPVLAGNISTETKVQPSFSISNLSVGSHSITAVYSGDNNYGGNTSAVLIQTVN
jgi:uncharacterized protein (TIGR03437 family)